MMLNITLSCANLPTQKQEQPKPKLAFKPKAETPKTPRDFVKWLLENPDKLKAYAVSVLFIVVMIMIVWKLIT